MGQPLTARGERLQTVLKSKQTRRITPTFKTKVYLTAVHVCMYVSQEQRILT